MVDWERDASYSYSVASASVPFVARDLEYFLKELVYYSGMIESDTVHLVGFGLGAHIAGIASRHLDYAEEWTEIGVVGRITGKYCCIKMKIRTDNVPMNAYMHNQTTMFPHLEHRPPFYERE